MNRSRRLVTCLLTACGLAVMATSVSAQHYAHSGLDACTTCKANVDFYGHYPTRWRPWPGESRMDIHFPQAIGAEEVQRGEESPRPKLPTQKLEPLMPGKSSPMPNYPPAEQNEPQVSEPVPPPAGSTPQPPAMVPEPVTPNTPFRTEQIPTPSGPAPLPNNGTPPGALPSTPPDANSQGMSLPATVPPGRSASLPPWSGPVASTPVIPPPTSTTPPKQGSRGNSAAGSVAAATGINDGASVRISLGAPRGNLAAAPAPLVIRNTTFPAVGGVATPGLVPGATPNAPAANPTDVARCEWLPEVKPTSAAYSQTSQLPSSAPSRAVSPAVAFQPEAANASQTQRAGYVGLNIPDVATQTGFEPTKRRVSTPFLDGFCPVQLVENERWIKGSPQYSAEWKGRVYWLSDASAHQRFLANAERYTPALSGLDPVKLIEGKRMDGSTDYCVVYDGRLYMFSSTATLAKFRQSPRRYAAFAASATP